YSAERLVWERTRMITSGVLVMLVLQFIIIPGASRPILPVQNIQKIQGPVCLISDEPWDGFQLQLLLPHTEIQHSVPGNSKECIQTARFIIDGNGALPPDSLSGLRLADSWNRWKNQMAPREILAGLLDIQSLQYQSRLYSNQGQTLVQPAQKQP
ncbi:MAG: hypothetical protein KDK39_02385, partial [Leptospiraceae bacterium]|nr:hypothetical protein [Leptospiraceae bacterium]